jgi:hypothetical protein
MTQPTPSIVDETPATGKLHDPFRAKLAKASWLVPLLGLGATIAINGVARTSGTVGLGAAGFVIFAGSIVVGFLLAIWSLCYAGKYQRVLGHSLGGLVTTVALTLLVAAGFYAISVVRTAAETAASLDHLRELAIGMHRHHDTRGAFPSHASYARDERSTARPAERNGKPLLSWRVHLLPFIDQAALWKRFTHDEPWDSPHNRQLISSMPSVYTSPGRDLGEGQTCYLVPMSNDQRFATAFPSGLTPGNIGGTEAGVPKLTSGCTMGSITDGTSNTIMIVEVPPEKAVIWTKPDDWEVDPSDPKKGLFGARTGFLLAATADAEVHRIPDTVSAETLKRALGRSDGASFNRQEIFGPLKSKKR